MATRIRARPSVMRKYPRQARSRATIEAILEAGAHILGERGWDSLTTNAVAARAGVSIGSLYQYFPNKLALIEAVRRRHFDEVLTVLRRAADEDQPRAARIEALVDGMIGVHAKSPAAHRVLLEETPRGRETRSVHDQFAAGLQRSYEAIVKTLRGRTAANSRIAAQVLASAVAGVVHDAASRGTLDSEALRCELIKLVRAYLL
jgi:AcrR family transcriptional regulator